MDYYGLLFLYYLKGLSGKSVLRLFFNIEAGGTEQLLPENTSTPTTSPLLADIQYPDGLRTDQYFTYRETPTTVSNKARIKTIKGNTLKWNQLVENGNFADGTTGWVATRGTINSNNNICYYTVTQLSTLVQNNRIERSISVPVGHKIYGSAFVKVPKATRACVITPTVSYDVSANVTTKIAGFFTTDIANFNFVVGVNSNTLELQDVCEFSSIQCIDVTQIFGSGNEPTTVEQFETWLSTHIGLLPYYDYNTGTLLSFNGTGIKTVGFNQWDEEWELGGYNISTGSKVSRSDAIRSIDFISIKPNTNYYFHCDSHPSPSNGVVLWYDKDKRYLNSKLSALNTISISPLNAFYMTFYIAPETTYNNDVCINISDTELNGTYEPYTSHTTNLPVSTYFPTGMKSAGSVYDELTPTKAVTRIGAVDLGSLDWQYSSTSTNPFFYTTGISSTVKSGTRNGLCSLYKWSEVASDDKHFALNGTQLRIYDFSYTDVATFKSAMNGVYLYYELATPTETPITTEDANEALSLLMGKSVSSDNAKQLINIITKGE